MSAGAVLLCSALLSANCHGSAELPPPPRPSDLATLDPGIASEIARRLAVVEATPSDEQAWMQLAAVYQAHGESELAAQCYRVVTALDPDQPRAHYLLALVDHRLGQTDRAIDGVRRAATLAPEYLPARLHLALWLLQAGRVSGSLQALQRVPEHKASDPAVVGLLARAHLQAGDAATAVALLERHLEAKGSDRYARGLLARAYRRVGRIQEAERELARGESERPAWDDPWLEEVEGQRVGFSARLARATALLASQPEVAVDRLRHLHEERPENATALINLGIGLRRVGRLEESAAALERAVETELGRGLAHMHLALTRAQMADLEIALEHARAAVELQPTASRNRAVLAEVLAQAGRPEDAVAAYRQAVADVAHDPAWDLRLGQLLCQLERWDEGVAPLARYVGIRGEDAEGWFYLGITKANLGQLEAAGALLERARSLQPDDPRIRAALRQLTAATNGADAT